MRCDGEQKQPLSLHPADRSATSKRLGPASACLPSGSAPASSSSVTGFSWWPGNGVANVCVPRDFVSYVGAQWLKVGYLRFFPSQWCRQNFWVCLRDGVSAFKLPTTAAQQRTLEAFLLACEVLLSFRPILLNITSSSPILSIASVGILKHKTSTESLLPYQATTLLSLRYAFHLPSSERSV